MRPIRWIWAIYGMVLLALPRPGWTQAAAHSAGDPAPAGDRSVMLDRAIAVINGEVLLQSDLREEMELAVLEPLTVPGRRDSEARAARRLINRTLILQQMKEQRVAVSVSAEEETKGLEELQGKIPVCARYRCETAEGWGRFLTEHNLTNEEVNAWLSSRLAILKFIDLRFRNGIRITPEEVKDYYSKSFVPQFAAEQAKAPALDTVSSRIEEILLQQRVNGLLQEWLKSLREQGSVQILDPKYGQSSGGDPESEDGGGV